MGNIKKFDKFINVNENQSKKIRKYVDFSTFLDWFNKNRPVIAKILECDVDEIVDEETILKQSAGLIQHVINPQSSGNRGRDGVIELSGFKEFKQLKSKIIHDILHNIYDVTEKDFSRTNDFDYDESEYVEEIEVLALEETFMKYFNLEYVKSDFLNGNINRLACFMMMVIIKNDPDRIVSILDGDIEPYIEVYGEKYSVEDTPFQNFYKMFEFVYINPLEESEGTIESGDDFEQWVSNMCAIGDAISSEGGDRAQFPGTDFLGDKDMSDLEEKDYKTFIDSTDYHYKDESELEGYSGETGEHDLVITEYELPDDMSEVLGDSSHTTLTYEELPKSIKEEERFLDMYNEEDYEGEKKFPIAEIYQITDNDSIEEYGFFDRDEVKIIVEFKGSARYNDTFLLYQVEEIDENEDDNDEEGDTSVQYTFLKELDGLYDDYSGDIVSTEDLWNAWFEFYDEEIKSKDIDDLVNYGYYNNQSLDSNVRSLFNEENSHSIARRYLRHNDTLVNNTDIAKNKYVNDSELSWQENQDKKQEHSDKQGFESIGEESFDSSEYISLGKHLTTNNAKKLKQVFDTFRGWTIKNFDDIKSKHKKLKSALSKDDLFLIENMNEYLKQENEYHNGKKDSEGKYSDAYVLYTELSRKKDAYNFYFDNIKNNESGFNRLLKYAETFERYKALFKKFEDDDILNYIKKIPSITETESIKKNINRFDDMFKNNETKVILQNKPFIDRLIKVASNLDYKKMLSHDYPYEGYVSSIEPLGIKTEKGLMDALVKGMKIENNENIKINPNFETKRGDENIIKKIEGDSWIEYGINKLRFKIKK
jgi:hypothetical protein